MLEGERFKPTVFSDLDFCTKMQKNKNGILGQKLGYNKYAIYYLSKKFTDCESRYFMLEKTCFTLAWVAKCLGSIC